MATDAPGGLFAGTDEREELTSAAEIDRAFAARTAKALVAKRKWFVEHIAIAARDRAEACAQRLDFISNHEDGFIHDVHAMADDTFVIIWWRYDETEATR